MLLLLLSQLACRFPYPHGTRTRPQLAPQVLLLLLSQLACSLSLRRASAVCRSWRARLRRGQRDADQLFESAWLNLPVVDPLDGRVCLGVAGALLREGGEDVECRAL